MTSPESSSPMLSATQLAQNRLSQIQEMQAIIRNDLFDYRRRNDIVVDVRNEKCGYKIVVVERDQNGTPFEYELLIDQDNKFVLKNESNLHVMECKRDGQNYLLASSDTIKQGREMRKWYIKDLQRNVIIKNTIIADSFKAIRFDETTNLYIAEGRCEREDTKRLLDHEGKLIDKGEIKLLEKDLYVKYEELIVDHESRYTVLFNKISKDEKDQHTTTTIFKTVQIPSDYETHQDNYFTYAGNGIVVEGAPRGSYNIPTPHHLYQGEFGQATDIFSEEKKQTPVYTGNLYCISPDLFAVRSQVFPTSSDKDGIWNSREHKYWSPYLYFVNFEGKAIAKKPYYQVKRRKGILFAQLIPENMIKVASKMEERSHPDPIESGEGNEYINAEDRFNKFSDNLPWVVIDTVTLDPANKDELIGNFYPDASGDFVTCVTHNQRTIYRHDGSRKAAGIKTYKSLQGEIYECDTATGKVFYDKEWNLIEL